MPRRLASPVADAPPQPAGRRRRPPRWKRRVWGLAATLGTVALFFALLEGALALAGVQPPALDDDPYVGFSGSSLFVRDGDRWVTSPKKTRWFNEQSFAADKPDDVVRIACVGGSTTYGRPYDDRTSFSGWLRTYLEQTAPGRCEVINAGGVSYASYRVAAVVDELLERDVDVLVVYTGHNEFLEERTYAGMRDVPAWLLATGERLSALRTFTALRDLFAPAPPVDELSGEVATRLDVVGPEDYERDETWRASVLEHLRTNLERIAARADAADVDLVFVVPASQLRDCAPFHSEPDAALDADALARAAQLRDVAAALPATAHVDARVDAWRAAVDADPRFAHASYELGEALWDAGEHRAAREAFVRARDEDVCPLRAPSEVAPMVRDVAARHDAVLIDFERWTASHAEHGVPGRDLFLDHVHPTIEMHHDIAAQALIMMITEGVLPATAQLAEGDIAAVRERVTGSLTPADHAIALRNLAKVLGWAGKREEAAALAAEARALSGGGDAEALFLEGTFAMQDGRPDDAVASLRAALDVDPTYAEAAYNLGEAYAALGRWADALPHFEHAAAAQPEKLSASNNLALMHLRLDDPHRALTVLDALLARAPDYARAHHNRATALVRLKRYGEAEPAYRRAATLDAGYAKPRHALGVLLTALGRRDEAVAVLEEAVALAPDDTEFRAALEAARAGR